MRHNLKTRAQSTQAHIERLQRAIRKQTRPLQKRIRSLGAELSRALHADLQARGLVLFDCTKSPGNVCLGTRADMKWCEEDGGGVACELSGPIRRGKDGYQIRIDGRWHNFQTPTGW